MEKCRLRFIAWVLLIQNWVSSLLDAQLHITQCFLELAEVNPMFIHHSKISPILQILQAISFSLSGHNCAFNSFHCLGQCLPHSKDSILRRAIPAPKFDLMPVPLNSFPSLHLLQISRNPELGSYHQCPNKQCCQNIYNMRNSIKLGILFDKNCRIF